MARGPRGQVERVRVNHQRPPQRTTESTIDRSEEIRRIRADQARRNAEDRSQNSGGLWGMIREFFERLRDLDGF